MKRVFEYLNYRAYLKDFYEERKVHHDPSPDGISETM
jgi:hypothetical protein